MLLLWLQRRSQMQLLFNPWPGNSHMLWPLEKKKDFKSPFSGIISMIAVLI